MSTETNFDKLFDETLVLSGGSGVYLNVEGTWVAKVTEALYAKNKAGTQFRGEVKIEVLEALDGSEDRRGATTSVYINEATSEALTQRNTAPWAQTLISMGVPKDKILDDVKTYQELIQSIISILNKAITRGTEIKVKIQTKKQGKVNEKGHDQFYKNVYVYSDAPAAQAE